MYRPVASLTTDIPFDGMLNNTINPNGGINTLNPMQKYQIITTAIGPQQSVGYLGDGNQVQWDYLQIPGMHTQKNREQNLKKQLCLYV